MMEYIQISPGVYAPERTAQLAKIYPEVRRCLELGIDVLHYEDRRQLDAHRVTSDDDFVARSVSRQLTQLAFDNASDVGASAGSTEPFSPDATLSDKWSTVFERTRANRTKRTTGEI